VPTVAILGPGGVGGFLAAALARAGTDTLVVAREETAELIAREGIALTSVRLGDFTAHPRATSTLDEPADVLFIATKASGLESALDRIATEPPLVIPLLNGLDHMVTLRARFGWNAVIAGAIRIEADRPEPGHITQTSPFLRVDLASDDPALVEQLQPVKAMLEAAEVPATLGNSESQILWAKLVRLNALACTTSASDRQLGFIRSDPEWRARLEACVAEAAAVGNADGATLDPANTMRELKDAHAELGSSMQRDIAAGREPELDAIPGAVLRAGKRLGVPCPTIAELAARIAERAGVPPPRV
jgi:2-dehydropantoate 2-reductase